MTRNNILHREIAKGICGAFAGYRGEIDLGDENTVAVLATGIEVHLSENLDQHGFVIAPIAAASAQHVATAFAHRHGRLMQRFERLGTNRGVRKRLA